MARLIDLLEAGTMVAAQRPWPRSVVEAAAWKYAGEQLAEGHWSLLGLWAEPEQVHMALREPASEQVGVISLACPEGHFPSIGHRHPPAIRLERSARDLFGLRPDGLEDTRPWLDHGCWPGGGRPEAAHYEFLPVEGPSLHQVPVGPVHAGIIEPGHFRFTANGETIVRLEERLGYVHKGIEKLMAGRDPTAAARLAARSSGDSTVAYGIGFALAVEAALQVPVPPRAHWLRALMAELERLANHLGDIGAVCNDAAFALMHTHCGALREQVLRTAQACFGHRLMRDRVVPGGVAVDLDDAGEAAVQTLLDHIGAEFPALVELYENTASLQDRTMGTGCLSSQLARQFGAGGYVGRASGQDRDARRRPGYAPYGELEFAVPSRMDGDVNARLWIRIEEVQQSMGMLRQILARLPAGEIRIDLPAAAGEGLSLVESFRGELLTWLRLDAAGRIERCHLRDPSWFQWPLLEAAVEGNIIADFPLCNKSFNCSYSGHDL
ncbi:MAG: hydrogenase expression protein HypE [Gammaproteobacteria bacterium]|nr:MAG: hydrogenase expression protein HypE [Gammaproteobacteria bacterium]